MHLEIGRRNPRTELNRIVNTVAYDRVHEVEPVPPFVAVDVRSGPAEQGIAAGAAV